MPEEFQPRRLRRRAAIVLVSLTLLVLIALLAPGLGDVRDTLANASAGWLAVAVLLEIACAPRT
jgi:cell division protein FtsW (lipid II flippase)